MGILEREKQTTNGGRKNEEEGHQGILEAIASGERKDHASFEHAIYS